MVTGWRWNTAAVALLAMQGAANADGGLPIRPGMSFAQVTELLEPTCLDYIVGGRAEKYITCVRGEGQTPEVVTATVNADDRTVYIQWRNLVGPSPAVDHAEKTARTLAFPSPEAECTIFQKLQPCWKDADGNTLYDGGYDAASGIHTFYLKRDGLE